MAGMPAPQPDPKQQLDAAHPIAPPAANQTNAAVNAIEAVSPQSAAVRGFAGLFDRTLKGAAPPVQHYADGTDNVQPVLPAAVANDPGWAARVALHNTLNPPPGPPVVGPGPGPNLGLFSRALPSNGAPTPTFAPIPRDANEASNTLSAVTGVPAHLFAAPVAAAPVSAQGQPVTQGGRSVTPPASPVSGPMRSYDNGNVQMTPGPISYVGPAPHEIPGTPEHTIVNGHNMSSDAFVNALRGVPGARVMQIVEALKPPSMQEQAARLAVQGAAQQGPGALQKMLIYLGLPQTAMFAQPAQGAVPPDGQ